MLRLLAALAALGAPAAAQETTPALWANYACAGGAVLQVAYFNLDPDISLAAVA